MNDDVETFLRVAAQCKCNLLFCGTNELTNINFMHNMIKQNLNLDDRFVYIQNSPSISFNTKNSISFEITDDCQNLIGSALKLRPDRIIVDVVQRGCTLNLLQAMCTGHDGSMGTVVSTDISSTLEHLVNDIYLSGFSLNYEQVIRFIHSSIDIIIFLESDSTVSSIYVCDDSQRFCPVVEKINNQYYFPYTKYSHVSSVWFEKIARHRQLYNIQRIIDLKGIPKARLKAMYGLC